MSGVRSLAKRNIRKRIFFASSILAVPKTREKNYLIENVLHKHIYSFSLARSRFEMIMGKQ
jgi:hypothetical protein